MFATILILKAEVKDILSFELHKKFYFNNML